MVNISKRAWILISALILSTVAILLVSLYYLRSEYLVLIITSLLFILLLDTLSIDLSKDTAITMSLPITYGISLYFHYNFYILPWIIVPAIIISELLTKKEWFKVVFNASATLISALICSITFSYLLNLIPNPYTYTSVYVLFSAVIAGLVYLISNTILVAAVVSFSYGYIFKEVLINQLFKKDQLAAVFLSFAIGYTGLILFQFNPYSLLIIIPFIYGIYLLFKRGRELETESKLAMEMAASTVDLRDPTYTSLHSQKVKDIAGVIARALDLPNSTIEIIESAALVHDIGKIGISDNVLKKPDKLNEQEWQEMKQHPQKGYELLKKLTKYQEEASLVLYHHQRWDGSGYPTNSKEKKIPLGARILALADAIESMLSDRPYRKKLLPMQVIEQLKEGSGTQFDPMLTKIAIDLINKGLIR